MCVCVCLGYHRRFKAFESTTFRHDGRVFEIHYGSGHMMGVMARDSLTVSNGVVT